jgi:hypothetical protein
MKRVSTFATIVAMVVTGAALMHAADIGKALAEAEGRRRAAESGVQQVQPKLSTDGNAVRAAYAEAATAQNAWLDAVIQSFDKGAAADATLAEAAAKPLVAWVNVRNRTLGQPEMTAAVSEGVRKDIVRNLVDIAGQEWKANHSADAKRRAAVVPQLDQHLRWKKFEDIH